MKFRINFSLSKMFFSIDKFLRLSLMSAKTLGQISCTLWIYLMLSIAPSRAQVSGGLPPLAAQPSQTQAQVIPSSPIAIPTPDERVRAIQEALNRKGFNAGVVDGYMGPQTQAAIVAAERASGLPITGSPSSTLLAALKDERETLVSIEASLLEDRRVLSWSERVKKYQQEVGKAIPRVDATLSGELSSPFFEFPYLAKRIEESQTWWFERGDPHRNMVFHNSTGKSLVGLVLKVNAGRCNSSEKNHYRFVTFAFEVKPNQVVSAYFPWAAELPTGSHCMDVVDVIFK
jgi:hypothetical protein